MTNSSLRDEVEEWRIWFWRALTLQYKVNTSASCAGFRLSEGGRCTSRQCMWCIYPQTLPNRFISLSLHLVFLPARAPRRTRHHLAHWAAINCTLPCFIHHGGLGKGTCSESLGAWGQPGTLQSLGQVRKPSNHEIICLNRRSEYTLKETLIIIFESIETQIFLVVVF